MNLGTECSKFDLGLAYNSCVTLFPWLKANIKV